MNLFKTLSSLVLLMPLFFGPLCYAQEEALEQSVSITATVEPSLTVSFDHNQAQVLTNWEMGYNIEKIGETYLVTSKI